MYFRATVQVLYPGNAKFDMDYYLKTHMPLVQKNWGSYGLKTWSVNKFEGTADGSAPPYSVMATLNWGSLSEFQSAAGGPEASTVLGDIPNFSDQQPIILTAITVGVS